MAFARTFTTSSLVKSSHSVKTLQKQTIFPRSNRQSLSSALPQNIYLYADLCKVIQAHRACQLGHAGPIAVVPGFSCAIHIPDTRVYPCINFWPVFPLPKI